MAKAIDLSALRNIKYNEWYPEWWLNSPNPNGSNDNMGIGTSFVYIPYWLGPALKRASLSFSDIFSYKKIRGILPPIEIARLLQCQSLEFKQLKKFSQYSSGYWNLFYSWAQECDKDPVLYTELQEVIRPLFQNALGLSEVKEHLYADNKDDGYFTDPIVIDGMNKDPNIFHNVLLLNATSVATVLEKGFLTAIEDRGYALRFISDYLKAQYGTNQISQVSYDTAFADYVSLL